MKDKNLSEFSATWCQGEQFSKIMLYLLLALNLRTIWHCASVKLCTLWLPTALISNFEYILKGNWRYIDQYGSKSSLFTATCWSIWCILGCIVFGQCKFRSCLKSQTNRNKKNIVLFSRRHFRYYRFSGRNRFNQ